MASADNPVAAKSGFRWPILQGILPVGKGRIPIDIIAGITLATLAIPEVMGYTKIAGMPVITGLYTIVVPIALFALLGSSRHLVVGADSATAAIVFAGLTGMAQPESTQWVALAGALALMTAGFLIIARVLRLGFLADFLSRTVLVGFLTGVGIQVAAGQVPGMLGVTKTGFGPIDQAFNALLALPTANKATIAVSASVLIVIVGSGFISKKIPGALIAVVGSIVASYALDLSAKGVSVLGPVPGGLPHVSFPAIPTSDIGPLIGTAVSLFIVILAQSAATSRAYAVKYSDRFNENLDLVGLAAANIGAGMTGTFVVNGSPTKTEMVDSAGGTSQISQLTTSVIVIIVLLFLTKPLAYMPNAVLASVVFLIGIKLVDIKGMSAIYKVRPGEFVIATLTAATVVAVGVEQGIILAIVLSVIAHLSHSYRPPTGLMSPNKHGHWKVHPVESGEQPKPGLAVYYFGANIYYANAERFSEETVAIATSQTQPVKWLVIEAAAIEDVDYSAAQTLREAHDTLAEHDVKLVFADLTETVKQEFKTYDLADLIGHENMYTDLEEAVEAYDQRDHGGSKN